jgi:hypothetical protein
MSGIQRGSHPQLKIAVYDEMQYTKSQTTYCQQTWHVLSNGQEQQQPGNNSNETESYFLSYMQMQRPIASRSAQQHCQYLPSDTTSSGVTNFRQLQALRSTNIHHSILSMSAVLQLGLQQH